MERRDGARAFWKLTRKHSERSNGEVPLRSRGGGKLLRSSHPSTAREKHALRSGRLQTLNVESE